MERWSCYVCSDQGGLSLRGGSGGGAHVGPGLVAGK